MSQYSAILFGLRKNEFCTENIETCDHSNIKEPTVLGKRARFNFVCAELCLLNGSSKETQQFNYLGTFKLESLEGSLGNL